MGKGKKMLFGVLKKTLLTNVNRTVSVRLTFALYFHTFTPHEIPYSLPWRFGMPPLARLG
jgi:hypothetical protein